MCAPNMCGLPLKTLGSEVTEGAVGAGTGTIAFGWKGGIGTSSSRVLPETLGSYTPGGAGAVQFWRCQGSDHLRRTDWQAPASTFPAARTPARRFDHDRPRYRCPFEQCRVTARLCVRLAAGLARTGGVYNHSSGDFVIAFSTGYRIEHVPSSLTAQIPMLLDERGLMNQFFHERPMRGRSDS